MTPEVAKIVGMQNQPAALGSFMEKLKTLVQNSRSEMRKNYDQWDRNDQIYRGERQPDVQDHQSRRKGEPEKVVLPLTFSQIQTFVSFGYSVFNSRDYFFEMVASGAEDETPSKMASAVLEQNLDENTFRSVQLIQLLTDVARFGVCVTKESWTNDQIPVIEQVPDQDKMAQARQGLVQVAQVPMKTQVTYETKYLGNRILNVSPYRWFPDTRLPLTRWKEGEFCADDNEYSKQQLEENERSGIIAGLEYVPRMQDTNMTDRRLSFVNQGQNVNAQRTDPNFYLITEVQILLNPSKTMIDNDTPLDKDLDCNLIYIVWIANDGRIVRISESGYAHNEFSWNCAQLFDDQNRFINFSLAEILGACQDISTWLVNSHITSVRRVIFNQLVVDPAGIEVDDIINRKPVIRTKPGRSGAGIDNWVKQLNVQDVTQNHMADMGTLSGMAKEATGINDSLLGQVASGRRSAREMGNVANAGAARLMMVMASIWGNSIAPMGKKMLSNIRQGLDQETMVRIYGQVNTQEAASVPDIPGLPPPLFRLIGITRKDLVGNYDFAVFNGTSQSERQQTAAVLQKLLEGMEKDPRLVAVLGLDPQLIALEVLSLLNVRNVQRFKLSPQRLQQLMLLAQPPANAGGPPNPGVGGAPQARPNV